MTTPAGLASLGALALGPQALGLAAGVAGLGVAAGSAVGGLAAFAAVAKGPVAEALKANREAAKGNLTALQALPPAERQLATELGGVTSAWSALQKAETPVIASALAPWLETATSGMQLLKPVVADVGTAVGELGTEADRAIKSPFWSQFSTVFGQTARVSVKDFGDAVGHVVDGLAHIFVTFAPDLQKLPPLVDKAAGSFDKWARSVKAGGLEDFFAKTFSPANVATLKGDLGSLATIVGNIAKAGSQLSPTAFSGLSNLLTVLAKLSPGQIEALATLYGVSKAVGGAGNLAKLATGGASLSLPGTGKKTAKTGTAAEEETAAKAGKFAKAGKVAGGVARAVPVIGAVSALDQAIPRGPGGEWVNSWAPYEKIFTNDLPQAWSISYEAFQRNFAGPMTNWFTTSLPHFFTAQVPMGWSTAYEGFQRDFAGPLTSWFTSSLPHFFTSSIPANVWSPAYEGFQRDVAGPITSWFSSSLPHFFTSGVPGAWSWAYQGFEQNVGSPVAAWFGSSVPHFFTSSVPSAWSWAYQGFERNVGSPVANWFGSSVPHFFTSSVPSAWSWAWSLFGTHVGSPVANWFSQSVPHFFTQSVPAAWSWAWSLFGTHVGSPVSSWFAHSLPSFVTRSIPGAFSSLWSSFSSNVVGPVANFFTSTLPGLASSAYSRAKSILGSVAGALGFASGTPSAPPGWAWVGERGPELMRFRGGEQVLSHSASLAKAQSLSALSSLGVPSLGAAPRLPGVGSPLRSGGLQLQVTSVATNQQLTDAIVQSLRFDIQASTGGDAQAHLGQGPVRITS